MFGSLVRGRRGTVARLIGVTRRMHRLFLSVARRAPRTRRGSTPLSRTSLTRRSARRSRDSLAKRARPNKRGRKCARRGLRLVVRSANTTTRSVTRTPRRTRGRETHHFGPRGLRGGFHRLRTAKRFRTLLRDTRGRKRFLHRFHRGVDLTFRGANSKRLGLLFAKSMRPRCVEVVTRGCSKEVPLRRRC